MARTRILLLVRAVRRKQHRLRMPRARSNDPRAAPAVSSDQTNSLVQANRTKPGRGSKPARNDRMLRNASPATVASRKAQIRGLAKVKAVLNRPARKVRTNQEANPAATIGAPISETFAISSIRQVGGTMREVTGGR